MIVQISGSCTDAWVQSHPKYMIDKQIIAVR